MWMVKHQHWWKREGINSSPYFFWFNLYFARNKTTCQQLVMIYFMHFLWDSSTLNQYLFLIQQFEAAGNGAVVTFQQDLDGFLLFAYNSTIKAIFKQTCVHHYS